MMSMVVNWQYPAYSTSGKIQYVSMRYALPGPRLMIILVNLYHSFIGGCYGGSAVNTDCTVSYLHDQTTLIDTSHTGHTVMSL